METNSARSQARKHAGSILALAVCGLAAWSTQAFATEKANDNVLTLDNAAAWVGGTGNTPPTSSDVAVFDGALLNSTAGFYTFGMGTDASWLGIQVTNPASGIAINAGNNLTLGTSGIDMSASTTAGSLTLNNNMTLGAAQSWLLGAGKLTVGSSSAVNNGGNLLTISNAGIAEIDGVISGAGGLTLNTGTLTVTGANTYTGATTVASGRLILNGTITSANPNVITIGATASATGKLDIGATGVLIATKTTATDIIIGSVAGTGVVTVSGGTMTATATNGTGGVGIMLGAVSGATGQLVVNSGLVTATSIQIGGVSGAYGNMQVNGGSIVVNGQLNDFANATTVGATSSFTMTNGVLSSGAATTGASTGYFIVGANNDNAMMLQTGGTITVGAGGATGSRAFTLATAGGVNSYGVATVIGTSVINVVGTSSGTNGLYVGQSGAGVLTIGGNAVINAVSSEGVVFGKSATTANGILNLDGGTLNASKITHLVAANGTGIVNFHGGVLQASASSATFFANVISTTAYVWNEGAIVDDGGFAITIGQNLVVPAGTGITNLTLAAANMSGYTSAPVIKITSGGGVGATAYATIDGSGNINNLVVSNPGTGYTGSGAPPTVTIYGGGKATIVDTGSVTFNAGNASGGFIKRGIGTVTLSGISSYTGNTIINAGRLAVTGTLTGNGNFNINNASILQVGGMISGTGVANVTSGTLVMSGGSITGGGGANVSANMHISGTGNLSGPISNSGVMEMTGGTVSGVVTVNSGGTLTGTASYSQVAINGGGYLIPGINGSTNIAISTLTLAANSNTIYQVNTVSFSPSQVVLGTSLPGGSLVLPASGTTTVLLAQEGTSTDFTSTGQYILMTGINPLAIVNASNALNTPIIGKFTLGSFGGQVGTATFMFIADSTTSGYDDLVINLTGTTPPNKWAPTAAGVTNWNADADWTAGQPSTTRGAIFDGTAQNFTPTLSADGTISSAVFVVSGYNVGAAAGKSLHFATGNSNFATIITDAGSDIISAPIILDTSGSLTASGTSTLTLAGAVSDGANGSQGLTVSGGLVVLSAVNSYSGATTVAGGTLSMAVAGTFGNGTGAVTNSSVISIANTGTNFIAAITNNGTIIQTAGVNTLSGVISGGGTLAVTGGTLTVSNADTYTGSTIISSGKLSLSGSITTSTTTQVIVGNVAASTGTLTVGTNGLVNAVNTATGLAVGTVAGANGVVNISGGSVTAVAATIGSGGAGSGGTLNLSANGVLATSGTFAVANGANSVAVVNLGGGTISSVGQLTFSNAANSQSVLNMTGGVVNASAADPSITTTAGANSFALFNLSGGTINMTNSVQFGTAGGNRESVALMSGGVINAVSLVVARTGDTATIRQTGGTVTLQHLDLGATGASAYGETTVGGSNVTTATMTAVGSTTFVGHKGIGIFNIENNANVTIDSSSATAGLQLNFQATTSAIVNLGTGGTLTTNSIQQGTASSGTTTGTFNFHGGKLVVSSGAQIVAAGFISQLTNAFVWNEGASIDDNGQSILIPQDLVTPTGDGVAGISLATPLNGYLAPPVVKITDAAGISATALANLDSNGNITTFTVTNPGTGFNSLTFAGSVTLFGAGGPVGNQTAAVTVAMQTNTAGDLTKRGSGTVALTSANNSYRNTIVSAGTLMVGNATATGSVGTGSVSVAAAGKLAFNLTGNQTFTNAITGSGTIAQMGSGITTLGSATVASLQNFTGSVNVTNGTLQLAHTNAARQSSTSGVLVQLSGLTIAPGSSFDITNHDLIIHYGSESAANAGYTNLFASAASAFAGGSWSGKGLTTSEADATQNGATVIMIESGDDFLGNVGGTFDGHAVTNGDVLVKYTLFGDVNLDGVTNDGDLGLIFGFYDPLGNGGLGGNGPMVGGDSNYDGFVGDGDLGAVFNLYDPFSVGPGLGGGFHGLDAPSTAAVPEPASLALLGIAAIGLVARRRNKKAPDAL